MAPLTYRVRRAKANLNDHHKGPTPKMFSGIVECQSAVLSTKARPGVLAVTLARPESFDDLKVGDSIAVNGVCLTVESFDQKSMTFALGLETLMITGWTEQKLKNQILNLERSLKLGDRLHGHIVSGHVEAMGEVVSVTDQGEFRLMDVEFPVTFKGFLWPKGSITVNGVSLTINQVDGCRFSVGLIPETMKRTNLKDIQAGARVTLESDQSTLKLKAWMRERELNP